jgi:hypothetical protein
MEDGIERSIVNYEKKEKEKEKEKEKYVYIFLQSNGNNYIIFFDNDKAIEYSRKNSCRVEIFIESESSVYTSTKNYYENGVLGLFSV